MALVRAVAMLLVMVMWVIMVLASWFVSSWIGFGSEAPGWDFEIPGLDPGALAPASGAPGPRPGAPEPDRQWPDPLRSHSEAYHEGVPSSSRISRTLSSLCRLPTMLKTTSAGYVSNPVGAEPLSFQWLPQPKVRDPVAAHPHRRRLPSVCNEAARWRLDAMAFKMRLHLPVTRL